MATILAIETSCDETAIAIIRNGELLSNVVATQIKMHVRFGGVMPEMAARLHAENILFVLDEALNKANVTLDEIDAFAVTRGPGLIGALHVGLQMAKTLAMLFDKPLIPVHHLAGHILANEYQSELEFPLLAVVVSGGNTELVYMKEPMDFEVIGETRDDAVGECFDKVARSLGLPYPGGVPIDRLAKEGKHTYKLPKPLHDKRLDFSYSGLKTAVINVINTEKMKNKEINVPDMCRSFEDVAIGMIIEKVKLALSKYHVKEVLLAGGVSANSYLRDEMKKALENSDVKLLIPPLWLTGDNGAMIARVAEKLYEMKVFASLDLSSDPNWRIENWQTF